jgi:peptidoglycan/LPS O-acetylase OafA/YrhL
MSTIVAPKTSLKPSLGGPAHVPALDGLRGIAALMVLFYHFIICAMQAPGGSLAGYFYKVFRHTYSGVDLFFVLSGFLITGILLNDIGKPKWLTRFWIRRTFRIIPIYVAFLCLVCLFSGLFKGMTGGFFEAPEPRWPYFLMLQNIQMAIQNSFGSWGITWSLAIEEQFYLVFPLMLYFGIVRRFLPLVCLLGIALSLILRLNGEYLYSFVLTPYRLDGLAAGAMCAWLVKRSHYANYLTRPWVSNCIVCIGVVLLLGITARLEHRHPVDHAVFAFSYAVILLHVVLSRDGLLSKILASSWLKFVGSISYPLYLFHEICFWLTSLVFGKATCNSEVLFVALISGFFSIFVAIVITRYLGDPFLVVGRRLAERQ